MNSITRRCPLCKSNSLLQPNSGPDFDKGLYYRIFRCDRGHVFAEKFKLSRKAGEPEVEVMDEGTQEDVDHPTPKWWKSLKRAYKEEKK